MYMESTMWIVWYLADVNFNSKVAKHDDVNEDAESGLPMVANASYMGTTKEYDD